MKTLKHGLAVLLALFLLLGVPALCFVDVSALGGGAEADAVSRATVELPDTPSGNFTVFLNRDRHRDTAGQWRAFMDEADYGVLLENVHCLVIAGDETALRLAERYQARLAKGQMAVRRENGVLAASRLDWGQYDLLIVSREMAEAWQLAPPEDAEVIEIAGVAP